LAAGSAANHKQTDSFDAQSLENVQYTPSYTYTTESQNISANELWICHPAAGTTIHHDKTFPAMLSGFLHHLSGTSGHKQFCAVTLGYYRCSTTFFCKSVVQK